MSDPVELEKSYHNRDVAAKLRRLAEALEEGKPYEIQIAGKRIYVPANATIAFEYELSDEEAEFEVEIKWNPRSQPTS